MRVLGAAVTIAAFFMAGPALALGVNLGGTSISVGSGGASVTSGGTSASVSTGGGGALASVTSGGNSASAGTGGGGTSASAGSGSSSAGASIGGGGGSYASLGADSGGTSGQIGITDSNGNPIDIKQSGGATAATVNLGSALDSFLTDPARSRQLGTIDLNTALNGIGPRNSPAERVRGAFRTLSFANRRKVRLTCAQVMRNPQLFNKDTRILCSLIARL